MAEGGDKTPVDKAPVDGEYVMGQKWVLRRGYSTPAVLDFTHAHLHRCMYLFSVQVRFSTLHAPVHVSSNHLFHDVSQCTQHNDKNLHFPFIS